MYDRPWSCENAAPGAIAFDCPSGADEQTLNETDMFQTLVAVDTGFVNGVHTATIYGGVTWRYTCTNSDTPEPAFGAITGALLLGLAGFKRLFGSRSRACRVG